MNVLSERDTAILLRLIETERQRTVMGMRRTKSDDVQENFLFHQGPEVYWAQAPGGGIPANGVADCSVFTLIVNDKANTVTTQAMGFTRPVSNPTSTAIAGSSFFRITRSKGGPWLPDMAGGVTGSGIDDFLAVWNGTNALDTGTATDDGQLFSLRGGLATSSLLVTMAGGGGSITGVDTTTGPDFIVHCVGHGFPSAASNGNHVMVKILGVGGATGANNHWRVTVTDADHFRLDGSGTGGPAYTSGGTAYPLTLDLGNQTGPTGYPNNAIYNFLVIQGANANGYLAEIVPGNFSGTPDSEATNRMIYLILRVLVTNSGENGPTILYDFAAQGYHQTGNIDLNTMIPYNGILTSTAFPGQIAFGTPGALIAGNANSQNSYVDTIIPLLRVDKISLSTLEGGSVPVDWQVMANQTVGLLTSQGQASGGAGGGVYLNDLWIGTNKDTVAWRARIWNGSSFDTGVSGPMPDGCSASGGLVISQGNQAGGPLGGSTTSSVSSTTTAETKSLLGTIHGTFTDPGNFQTVGKTMILRAYGVITTGATAGTITFRIRYNNLVTIASTGAQAPTVSQTNRYWEMVAEIICRTTGGTGTFFCQGHFSYMNAATPASLITWPMRGNDADPPATATVNTSTGGLIDFQSITSNNLHTITCNLVTLEVVGPN